MSKSTKKWLIIAASLILIGCIAFGGLMAVLKWDFLKLSTNKYEINTYEINDSFKSISVACDTADIEFIPCENSKAYVECYEQKNIKYSVSVKDGALTIEVKDTRKWYEHIGINLGSPKLTVYIPKGEYGDLVIRTNTGDSKIPKDFSFTSIDISQSTGDVECCAYATGDIKIKTSTGKIRVDGVSASSLNVSASTGRITATGIRCDGDVTVGVSTGKTFLTDVECRSVTSTGSTGDITLKSVIAEDKISVERDTGDIVLDASDAAELYIVTDTGDVTGTLLSSKVFIVNTDTGKKKVPDTVTGGRCEITTDTGDIIINIKSK